MGDSETEPKARAAVAENGVLATKKEEVRRHELGGERGDVARRREVTGRWIRKKGRRGDCGPATTSMIISFPFLQTGHVWWVEGESRLSVDSWDSSIGGVASDGTPSRDRHCSSRSWRKRFARKP